VPLALLIKLINFKLFQHERAAIFILRMLKSPNFTSIQPFIRLIMNKVEDGMKMHVSNSNILNLSVGILAVTSESIFYSKSIWCGFCSTVHK